MNFRDSFGLSRRLGQTPERYGVASQAVLERLGAASEVFSSQHLNNGPHMMMRTVFSLSLLILPVSMVIGAEQAATKSDADFATLVRNHGFVSPALVQNADEATAGEIAAVAEAAVEEASVAPAAEAIVESSAVPMPIADASIPAVDSEGGYQAPIRHQHHHYSAPQRRSSRGGVFSELMELERRKNAWLKRTFLGR